MSLYLKTRTTSIGCPFRFTSASSNNQTCPLRALFPKSKTNSHVYKSANNGNKFSFSNINNPKNNVLTKTIRQQNQPTRFHKILSQNPRFKHYYSKFSEAGTVPTITSFLILHEFSAVLPLFIVWWSLYQLDLQSFDSQMNHSMPASIQSIIDSCNASIEKLINKNETLGKIDDKKKLILTGTLSYAIVKLIYPLRIVLCLWASPYCGKFIYLPVKKIKSHLLKRHHV